MNAVLILLAVLAIGAGAYVSWWLRKRRREALAHVAKRLGLAYSAEDTTGSLALPFALLRRGDGRGVENVLEGTWEGVELREFDYWYYEESTDSQGHRTRTYHRFSCAVTEVACAFPGISIARENVLTRIADSIGLDDIAFEHDGFNRAFNVKARDRRFANDLVDQRMMAWLMTTDGLAFEAAGRWLLAYDRRRSPDELVGLLGAVKAFREQVPRVVYDLYGSAAGG